MPNGGAPLNVLPPAEIVAPGDDMGAGHGAEFLRPGDACEPHEIPDGVLVGAPCAGVTDIGEPLDLGRDIGKPLKPLGGKQAFARSDLGRELGVGMWVGHVRILILDKICFKNNRRTGRGRELPFGRRCSPLYLDRCR
jgi:hypothetical protein